MVESSMAEHVDAPESLTEKISEMIHDGQDFLSSLSPAQSISEAVKSTKYRLFGREKPVHKLLGGGKPADVFLWRDKKVSGVALGAATVLWAIFELLKHHFITLVCYILILSLAIPFIWVKVAVYINAAPPKFPELTLPEDCVLALASTLINEANLAISCLRDIASGRDMKKFFSVIAGLWVVSIIGNWFNLLTSLYISFVLLHTVPLFYEKYEDQVDFYAEKAMIEIKKQYKEFDAKFLCKIPKGPAKEKKTD